MTTSKVYLIGAGPGDPGLLTVKGHDLLAQADVVLYDALICPEILSIADPDAELIPVGKRASNHTLPQDQTNQLLVDKAKQGKTVVRLKGGDPYMFGRGGEEALHCVENGVEFEVVPGVTSPFAASCYAGIPTTQRGYTTSVAVVTGHRKQDDTRPIDIPKAGTVVFLMSVKNIGMIIDSLLADGWDASTPIAAIEHGTWYDQRTVTGTLENFRQTITETPLRTPAIFVVGEVVKFQDQLNWYAKKPRILMLGTHPEKYKHLGTIVHRQLIDCVALDDYTNTDKQIDNLVAFNWVVFTSANGIRHFFARLAAKGLDSRSLANSNIGVIGAATAQTLAEYGIKADLCAATESSKGLLEEFAQIDMTGKTVLLPQAQISSELLAKGLETAGATVTKSPVYKTIECQCKDVDFDYIDQILFTSGSSVRAFIKRFGAIPKGVKALTLGLPTQTIAAENNIQAEILPKDTE